MEEAKGEEGFLTSILETTDIATQYKKLYEANENNVISGVVSEDHPVSKVLHHFYHAYTGKPLTIGTVVGDDSLREVDDSLSRALGFLKSSVNIYSYEAHQDESTFNADEWVNPEAIPNDKPYAKMLSFHKFGEALHHVEDMSSIAHVHNDAHLSFFDPEHDDYEGKYIPNKIFQLHNRAGGEVKWFKDSEKPFYISGIKDIWPEPSNSLNWSTKSLARKVFNASIFKAKLPLPGVQTVIQPNKDATVLYYLKDSPYPASGELVEMFGDKLRTYQHSNIVFPVWKIEGVGDWHYLDKGTWTDAWWPITEFNGPAGDADGEQYFYLEQKMGDEYNTDADLVKVEGIRENLFDDFSPENNIKFNKDTILLQVLAEKLIPLAIEYTAGFSQYWYDHVNSPPYLKSVIVRQKALAVKMPNMAEVSDEYEFIGYQARWQNVASTLTTRNEETAIFTSKRKLKKERLTQPLYNNKDIEIILAFSEAIKPPANENGVYDSNSGFKLSLEVVTKDEGALEETSVDLLELDMSALEFEANSDDTLEAALIYKSEDPINIEKHMKGSVWKIIIKASELKKSDKLQGAVRLVVHAEDRNKHRTTDLGVVQGHKLDSTPNTPARVYATIVGDDIEYLWHNATSFNLENVPEFIASVDEEGNLLPEDAFSYDYQEGDNNHILWFSSPGDNDFIPDIQTGEAADAVLITTLPEEELDEVDPSSIQ
jgi:hypothetical protein